MEANILIVDDEKEIADLIEVFLENENYNVYKFYDGEEALGCVKNTRLDLAILDLMLPKIDGFEILRRIRKEYNFPVIMLTARVEDMDKITGLMMGADDYITKPFNPLEMVARVKAQLRRYTKYNENIFAEEENIIEFSGLMINKETHECFLYGKKLALTPIEFSILWLLCENRGKVISSEELFEKVWGEKFFESNNTVMVHIRRLREKMNEPQGKPKFIKTVWGVGYKIEK
jgi:two-component system response regulator VanR